MHKMCMLILVGQSFIWQVTILTSVGAENGLRTWTSRSGDKLEATYVEQKYGQVKLQGTDGKPIKIPCSSLIQPDRAWIKKHEADLKGTGAIEYPDNPLRLPVFADGKWKGLNAVYSCQNFDAVINEKGQLVVYPKEKGERVKKRLWTDIYCKYHDRVKDTNRYRPRVRYTDSPEPSLQPKKVELQGMLKDGVEFSITYTFSDKRIRAWGDVKDPRDIASKTYFKLLTRIPCSHRFRQDTSFEERRRILDGWQLVLRPVEGKRMTFAYATPVTNMYYSIKQLDIDAPLFGKRRLTFKLGKGDSYMKPWVYNGTNPWEGFQLWANSFDLIVE